MIKGTCLRCVLDFVAHPGNMPTHKLFSWKFQFLSKSLKELLGNVGLEMCPKVSSGAPCGRMGLGDVSYASRCTPGCKERSDFDLKKIYFFPKISIFLRIYSIWQSVDANRFYPKLCKIWHRCSDFRKVRLILGIWRHSGVPNIDNKKKPPSTFTLIYWKIQILTQIGS